MKRKTTLLVMAAGMGSRFGSLKQITPLGPHQKALLHYTIYDAVHAGFDKIVFVIRESFAKEFIDFSGFQDRIPPLPKVKLKDIKKRRTTAAVRRWGRCVLGRMFTWRIPQPWSHAARGP